MGEPTPPGSTETRPLRVLYSFPQPLGGPGVSTTAQQQVRGAIDRGCEVTVVATALRTAVVGARDVRTTFTMGGRKIPQRLIGVDRVARLHDRAVARLLRRDAADYDLVHCWPSACLLTLGVARDLGIAAVRESPSAHTAEALRQAAVEQEALGIRMARGHPFHLAPEKLQREVAEYDAAPTILVPSEHALETFVANGVARAKLALHRYGFDPARFPEPDAPAGGARGRPFTLVFAGRGEPTKGLHYALEAWARSGLGTSGRFVIAGTLLAEYRQRIAGLLQQPGVEVLPFTADIGTVFRAADALILPSVTEGSALVTYEAQASSCALLVSDASGAPCRDGEQGLVHRARDVATLTDQMIRLHDDPELLANLRRRALAHRPALTWDRAAARLVAIYREVARPLTP